MPESIIKLGADLRPGDVLVGSDGGTSLIHDITPSNVMPGILRIDTEHGPLYLDPENEYEVQ